MIYRMIYVSDICEGYADDLHRALDGARTYYQQHQITGTLWFDGEHFMQMLEGPKEELKTAIEQRIIPPHPHCHISMADLGPCKKRLFQDWRMTYLGKGSPLYDLVCRYTGSQHFNPHDHDTTKLAQLCSRLERARKSWAKQAIN